MIMHGSEMYLDRIEVRDLLALDVRTWEKYNYKIPFEYMHGIKVCKKSTAERIKEMLDPSKFLGEAQMIIECDMYYDLFHRVVHHLKIPTFMHPFHSRILYETSNIDIIRDARTIIVRPYARMGVKYVR
jgi:hypothetical protein